MQWTVLIPARAGSKGVLGKNTTLVGGRPLVCWAIERALDADRVKHVVVSTNDPEVEGIVKSRYAGQRIEVHWRPEHLASEGATIDQVVHYYTGVHGMKPLAVLQPTTLPGRGSVPLDGILDEVERRHEPHLTLVVPTHEPVWNQNDAGAWEAVGNRFNRQYQRKLWREVGWRFHTETYRPVDGGYQPHPAVGTYIDIDSPEDVVAAEHELTRRTILFEPLASERFGWGHLSRTTTIARRLQHHEILFSDQYLHGPAIERLHSEGWNVVPGSVYQPDVVVLDRLDTNVRQVADWVRRGVAVVTLEDEGSGASIADATINDMYRPHAERAGRHGYYYGFEYVVLRPEFVGMPPFPVKDQIERVLVTFGGTDPAGMTERVATWLAVDDLREKATIVVPPGRKVGGLGRDLRVVERPSMVREMAEADLVITSGGRTLYEAAAVGVPALVVLQNERESRHEHLGIGNINLGLGTALDGNRFIEAVRSLGAVDLRERLSDDARRGLDGKGAERVAKIIEGVGR